ncbi:MAG TPA: tetratricopeptide repeat protein [Nevskiaceae bacterium]|nr:tetratricopeptide repeat protein [Nevskiaceae bacterium]
MLLFALWAAGCATTAPSPSPTRSAPAASDAERAALPRFAEALTLMKNQQSDAALKAFLVLARDYPQFSGPPTNLGILYAKRKDTASAIASLRKAVAINPRNAIAWSWLGALQRNAGDFEHARESYLNAIAARPDYAPAHYNLAVLYDVCLKRPAEALAEYRAYRALDPDRVIVDAWIRELDATLAPTAVAQRGTQ